MPLSGLSDGASDLWQKAGGYVSRLVTPGIRLGVTGLARSGKTVFITALVRNLVEGGRLPFFTPAAEGRILRAYLEPQPDDDLPRFAYEDHLAQLTGQPPQWPDSTSSISQLRVTIEYEPDSMLRRALGTAMLRIDIVDYPGEWLIDLPLLDMSYEDWAQDALALARRPGRIEHAAEFLQFLSRLDDRMAAASESEPSLGELEQIARQGAQLFTKYLHAARADDHALSIAGPGRFLLPGDLAGSPLLTFFPMDRATARGNDASTPPMEPQTATAPASARNRTALAQLLTRRYQSYKSRVVKPFYSDHFSRLDRQIVLVDALSALNAGPAAIADLKHALQRVLQSFRPGSNSWLSSILFRRIDRLAFAATKADHLHHSSHDRLEAILELLINASHARAATSGAEVKVLAIAALRATRETEVRQNGEVLNCIQGVALPGERLGEQTFDGKTAVAIFPGDLPADPADALNDTAEDQTRTQDSHQFIRFSPPAMPQSGYDKDHSVWPHIRLDRALEFLIGDRLQ